ncbi:hypothetical protein MMC22_008536 [Lobaria immixta]|nr:hypothetical protein [Lobaria immixta]
MSDKSTKMTQADAARIQSSNDTAGKDTGAGSFAARAQSAGDKNANESAGAQGGKGGDSTTHGSGTTSQGGK